MVSAEAPDGCAMTRTGNNSSAGKNVVDGLAAQTREVVGFKFTLPLLNDERGASSSAG
jgi:hypothetical protein